MRRSIRTAATMLAATVLLAGTAALGEGATTTPLNTNLVRDGSAEQASGAAGNDGYTVVPIPGWVTTSNFTAAEYGQSGCPTKEQAAQIGGGKYFFYGGPDNALSTAKQTIALTGRSSKIDSGHIKVKISAWLGGWGGQADSARLRVQFLRSDGTVIGSVQTVAVSATSSVLVHKTASKLAPVGTRKLRVTMVSTRAEGSYNDGMFDKIDVRLLAV